MDSTAKRETKTKGELGYFIVQSIDFFGGDLYNETGLRSYEEAV
jgi:hypothetical protein